MCSQHIESENWLTWISRQWCLHNFTTFILHWCPVITSVQDLIGNYFYILLCRSAEGSFQLNLTLPSKRLQTMPFLTQEPWVYDWGVSGCHLPQCLSGLAGSVFGCYLLFCVCLCVLFCMSEEMRPMKLYVLGFRVVAHISMLLVRGAHASVFPHPLFLFCVLIVTFPLGLFE